jgi:phage FluMu gp28-like protein
MIHAAQNIVGAVQIQCCVKREFSSDYKTGCEDALLILPGRKRIRSEPSALNQLNNKHNDGNHEQKMDQTAAKVADKAQKPEHH